MYLMHFNDYCHYIFLPFLFFWNSILNCTLFLKFQKRDKESQNFSNFIFHFQLFSSIFFFKFSSNYTVPCFWNFERGEESRNFSNFYSSTIIIIIFFFSKYMFKFVSENSSEVKNLEISVKRENERMRAQVD